MTLVPSKLAIVAACIVAGCATATPSPSPSASRPPAPTGTVTDTATLTPGATPTGPAALVTEVGSVTAVDAAAGTVTYRLSQFFQGEKAVAAAREDGRIGPNEDLPSPLYVRDLGRDERRALSPSASIMVLKPDAGGVPVLRAIAPREFLDVLEAGLLPDAWYGSPFYRFQVGPAGQVTDVEQLYVP